MRKPLQELILKSWKECIKRDYINQRINSERSLQASFWSCLNKNIQIKTNRQLFIETPIKVNSGALNKRVIPDIIICSPQKVIAVIELKYLPRGQPNYKKDIETLALISRYKHKIQISNGRFRGDNKKRTEYEFSSKVLFIMASVHAKEKIKTNSSYSDGNKYLKGCYIELHAETVQGKSPLIYVR